MNNKKKRKKRKPESITSCMSLLTKVVLLHGPVVPSAPPNYYNLK